MEQLSEVHALHHFLVLSLGLQYQGPLTKLNVMSEDDVDRGKYTTEVYGAWNTWSTFFNQPLNLGADMVFIPLLLHEHFFCVCIDFTRKLAFYMDNKTREDFERSSYKSLAVCAVDTYADFLISKGHEHGLQAKDFDMHNVPFIWQSDESNVDCGLFMMLHMMFSVGEPFDCELFNRKKRELYRAEVAATMILSDKNESRSVVPEQIRQLNEMKPKIIQPLLRKRENGNKKKKGGKGGKKNFHTPNSKIKAIIEDGSVSVLSSNRRGVSNGLGSTLDCGRGNEKILLVSKFMRNNQALLSNMLTLRKEVLDYCLLDDYDLSSDEVVGQFSEKQYLKRGDIMSLLPNVHVNTAVIESWAIILNDIEDKEKCSTSLIFFGIQHMAAIHSLNEQEVEGRNDKGNDKEKIFAVWDDLMLKNNVALNYEADIIFIPMVWEDHYFCVCINFKCDMVEVLDNTVYPNWEKSKVYMLADIVASYMSDYLEDKEVPRAEEIIDFEIVNVGFKWQTEELNNTESGNFLMMHMIRYEGEIFEADLEHKVSRRYYWGEIAASLLLADVNEKRTALLHDVNQFKTRKCEVWELLRENRRIKRPARKEKGKEAHVPVEKENPIEKENPKIDTEMPILRNSPRKRYKSVPNHRGGRARGKGSDSK